MFWFSAIILGIVFTSTNIIAGFGFIGFLIQELLHIPLGIV